MDITKLDKLSHLLEQAQNIADELFVEGSLTDNVPTSLHFCKVEVDCQKRKEEKKKLYLKYK